MIVNLHIERLVIEGLPVGAHEGPRIQAAVEGELARLIKKSGLTVQYGQIEPQPLISAEPIVWSASEGNSLGRKIAQAIHAGVIG